MGGGAVRGGFGVVVEVSLLGASAGAGGSDDWDDGLAETGVELGVSTGVGLDVLGNGFHPLVVGREVFEVFRSQVAGKFVVAVPAVAEQAALVDEGEHGLGTDLAEVAHEDVVGGDQAAGAPGFVEQHPRAGGVIAEVGGRAVVGLVKVGVEASGVVGDEAVGVAGEENGMEGVEFLDQVVSGFELVGVGVVVGEFGFVEEIPGEEAGVVEGGADAFGDEAGVDGLEVAAAEADEGLEVVLVDLVEPGGFTSG